MQVGYFLTPGVVGEDYRGQAGVADALGASSDSPDGPLHAS